MPKKKPKKDSGGVPEWVVTYGDMMSLLLCFFILLAAFSELKQEREYQRVITAVKEAFGYSGGVGVMPTDDPPLRSMLQLMEELAQKSHENSKISESDTRGVSGKSTKVTKVQEGMMFTIGGHLTFAPGSAVLRDEAKAELLRVAKLLKGRRNKIAVRGHASSKVLDADSPFDDLLDLSYYRAKVIAEFLATEGQLDPDVLVIEARGDTEPLIHRQYNPEAQTLNRRVEIIMTEVMVEDLNKDAGSSDESAARGEGGDW
ncbi:MAG: OmpA family protein [bacterium]|nr:OmpA family protein [bacterium]